MLENVENFLEDLIADEVTGVNIDWATECLKDIQKASKKLQESDGNEVEGKIKEFKGLLQEADLITIDNGVYLHTWDFEEDALISTKYEEDGLVYEININEDDVQKIENKKKYYNIITDDNTYKVSLFSLSTISKDL